MRYIVDLVAAAALLFIVVKGFFGSFWRKPPSRQDSTATDWSPYAAEDSVHHGPSDPPGPS